jgi:hypothetical protein
VESIVGNIENTGFRHGKNHFENFPVTETGKRITREVPILVIVLASPLQHHPQHVIPAPDKRAWAGDFRATGACLGKSNITLCYIHSV